MTPFLSRLFRKPKPVTCSQAGKLGAAAAHAARRKAIRAKCDELAAEIGHNPWQAAAERWRG